MFQIKDTIEEKDGITLAETTHGEFVVGILYRKGQVVNIEKPTVDFLKTTSLAQARKFFNDKVGK